jgi:hypothetical protein
LCASYAASSITQGLQYNLVEQLLPAEAGAAAEVRRRYRIAAERRFWAGYYARELFDAGIFVGLVVV